MSDLSRLTTRLRSLQKRYYGLEAAQQTEIPLYDSKPEHVRENLYRQRLKSWELIHEAVRALFKQAKSQGAFRLDRELAPNIRSLRDGIRHHARALVECFEEQLPPWLPPEPSHKERAAGPVPSTATKPRSDLPKRKRKPKVISSRSKKSASSESPTYKDATRQEVVEAFMYLRESTHEKRNELQALISEVSAESIELERFASAWRSQTLSEPPITPQTLEPLRELLAEAQCRLDIVHARFRIGDEDDVIPSASFSTPSRPMISPACAKPQTPLPHPLSST